MCSIIVVEWALPVSGNWERIPKHLCIFSPSPKQGHCLTVNLMELCQERNMAKKFRSFLIFLIEYPFAIVVRNRTWPTRWWRTGLILRKQGRNEYLKTKMNYVVRFSFLNRNPNEGTTKDISADWPEYSLDNQHYLEINTSLMDNGNSAVGYSFRRDYTVFWSRLVPQIYGSNTGACENVAINEFILPDSLQMPWTQSSYVRPKFELESPSAEDLLQLQSQSPEARDTVCGGSGDYIRQTR